MKKPNAFEQAHQTELKDAETVALNALKEIAGGKNISSASAIRVEAAKTILSIRSDDL